MPQSRTHWPEVSAAPPREPRGRRPPARAFLRRHPRLRQLLLALAALLTMFAIWVAATLYPVLGRPGTDSVAARVAEWGRDHHLGNVVTWLEQQSYTPPTVGGQVGNGSPLSGANPATARPLAGGLPAALRPFAAPALPGEGEWNVLSTVRGADAVAAAYLRPDATHTSLHGRGRLVQPQAGAGAARSRHAGPGRARLGCTD